ncbi:hypothetical protein F511_21420 [Dorcoceras hygrometricum]|uniref:Uncharacterized protein n=1 Tax=Dorcoceras hygrometricum TaxID=472368 RepID=A0A2Z7A322_9LAMI|nr:hypothetical protein F511_21420 [Dorcoceras hygrometricum]
MSLVNSDVNATRMVNSDVNTTRSPKIHKIRGIPRVRYITKITGTHGNGDRPAEPPLCPAWLPEDPASGQCYEYMRVIKGRIDRPVYQLAIISIEPLYYAQQVSRWKSSVRDLQGPSSHHSSVVFTHDKSVSHHSDDSVGLFRHNKSVGESQRGSQSGHKSICQAQYIPQMHDRTSWKMESVSKPKKSAQLKHKSEPEHSNTYGQNYTEENNETDFSKKLRTPVASRFHSNANSGLQMGSNRKRNSQRIQRRQNHLNHRWRSAAIDENSSVNNS